MRFLPAVLWFYVLLCKVDSEPIRTDGHFDLVPPKMMVVASKPECMSGFCWSVEDKPDWSQVIDLRSKP